jgi:glycosyltransferase involved in cell wall biosynthesis
MKILLLTNKSPWPPKDGGSSATLSMIQMLAANGASINILSFNTLKHYTDTGNIPGTFSGFHFVDLDSRIRPLNLFINFFFSLSPYTITRFNNNVFSEKLAELLKEEFDIVQFEGLAMASYLPVIRKCSRAKAVFRPHNVENNIWRQLAYGEKNIVKKIYYYITACKTERIEKKIANRFDAVTAISRKDKEWFIKNGCTKPVTVSSPCPASEQIINVSNISMSAAFIGALDWRPNINAVRWLVKKVWPIVSEALPEACLFVAGRNPDSSVRNICRGKNIIFAGEVPSSAVFLSDKEVIAVPLFSGSGIRMKILEGMSLGKPIVATTAAASGIIFEENKDLFIADDSRKFAEQIIRLLSDEMLRRDIGTNARENVSKNYDILASAEELMKFYTLLA